MMPGALVNLMTALICVENNQDLAGTQVTVKGSLFDAFVDYSYPSDLRYGEIYRGGCVYPGGIAICHAADLLL